MSRASLILILLSLGKTGQAIEEDQCTVNAECGSNFGHVRIVCCLSRNGARKCQYNHCLREICLTDGDCGGISECCRNNVCTNDNCLRCNSNSNCAISEYCCKQGYIPNVCRRSCVGELCIADSDCSGPGEYCDVDKKCAKSPSPTQLPCWGVALIVAGIIWFLFTFGVCLYCRYCKKTFRSDTQNIADNDTTITLEETNSHTTRPLATPPPLYDHLASKHPSFDHNQDQKYAQTDSNGYELPNLH